jgi:Fe-S oxidoreductase
VEFIEAEGEGCCGFGGLFSLQYGDISRGLLGKRVDAYDSTGAAAVVTSCTGCMLQLGSALRDKQVFHIIELIEEAFC